MTHVRLQLSKEEERIVRTFMGLKSIKNKEESIKSIIIEFAKNSSLKEVLKKFE